MTLFNFEAIAPAQGDCFEVPPAQVKYWNEYDGSDAGGHDQDYATYINPEEGTGFPGTTCIHAIVSMP